MPDDFEEPLGLRESFERMEPAIHVLYDAAAVRLSELDASGDVTGRFRDEDLARSGGRADARGKVHRPADVVAVLLSYGLAGVDADADRDPGAGPVAVLLGDRALDANRAQDRAARGLEGHHEAVALGLDDVAAVGLDVASDDEVLLADDLVGDLVAELLGGVGESSDITEENRDRVGYRHVRSSQRTVLFALRVLVHSGGASGGNKKNSRCPAQTPRVSKRCLAALPSDDAPGLEIEPRQAAGGHRRDLQADAQGGAEGFTHRRHTGVVVELDQDANLVELAVLRHLDLELVDGGEAPNDALDGRGEHVDTPDDQHVVEAAENAAREPSERA